MKKLFYWLKGGIIGISVVIIIIIIVFVFQAFVRYLVFDSGEYGKWNTCANQTRANFSETLRGTNYVDVEKGYRNEVFSKCGQQPEFAHRGLYDFGNTLERLILKGELGAYITHPLALLPPIAMLAYLTIDTPILLLMWGFIIGIIVGLIYGKIKSGTKQ